MNIDDDEIDLALCALHRFKDEMKEQSSADARPARITASAWWACMEFTLPRIEMLIARLEQRKTDRRNGDA